MPNVAGIVKVSSLKTGVGRFGIRSKRNFSNDYVATVPDEPKKKMCRAFEVYRHETLGALSDALATALSNRSLFAESVSFDRKGNLRAINLVRREDRDRSAFVAACDATGLSADELMLAATQFKARK